MRLPGSKCMNHCQVEWCVDLPLSGVLPDNYQGQQRVETRAHSIVKAGKYPVGSRRRNSAITARSPQYLFVQPLSIVRGKRFLLKSVQLVPTIRLLLQCLKNQLQQL